MHSIWITPHCLPSQKLSMYHIDFMDKWINKTQLIDLLSATQWLVRLQNPSNCFLKLGSSLLWSDTFFKFTLEVSNWWVLGIATIPKMNWSRTSNECKVCECALTAWGAVCLSAGVWAKPSSFGGENRTVLPQGVGRGDSFTILHVCRYVSGCHGGHDGDCVTFLLPHVWLDSLHRQSKQIWVTAFRLTWQSIIS